MTTNTPARIPCGHEFQTDGNFCDETNLCPDCSRVLIAHYNAPPPSDPAKHAEAVEAAKRWNAWKKGLSVSRDGYSQYELDKSTLAIYAAAYLDSLTPATGGE